MFSSTPVSKLRAYGKFSIKKVCSVDQFAAQSFNIAANGFIGNPLSQLARATSVQQIENILKRVTEVPSQSNLPKNIKLVDAFNYIKPRYAQSELECLLFAEQVAAYEQNQIDTASRSAVEQPALTPPSAEHVPDTSNIE